MNMIALDDDSRAAVLNKGKHDNYWLRCAKTFLPSAYTSTDSMRMSLAFFIVSAIDLLDLWDTRFSDEERRGFVEWIYSCQLPQGGFRGSPTMDLGRARNDQNAQWDPANLAATYFALLSLIILRDDLKRVKKAQTIRWLSLLQKSDGAFGEVLGEHDEIEGGGGIRHCYLAACVFTVLDGLDGCVSHPDDIDAFFDFISSCRTYDGGMSEIPGSEAHAGEAYCSLGALLTMNPTLSKSCQIPPDQSVLMADYLKTFSIDFVDLTRWLVSRQTIWDEEVDPNTEDDNDKARNAKNSPLDAADDEEGRIAGFNGRCNKLADTCYSYWVVATLCMLGKETLVDLPSNRRFLLERTQHRIGGFGKLPGDPPDIYHSYLALACLSLSQEPGLQPLDPVMCISWRARKHLQELKRGNVE